MSLWSLTRQCLINNFFTSSYYHSSRVNPHRLYMSTNDEKANILKNPKLFIDKDEPVDCKACPDDQPLTYEDVLERLTWNEFDVNHGNLANEESVIIEKLVDDVKEFRDTKDAIHKVSLHDKT